MNHHDDRLFEALSSLGEREWRAPDLDDITKERTMRTSSKRPSMRLAIGVGVALLAASAVGAATWYAGVFEGVLRDQDGNEYNVELRETEPGVFVGQSTDGHSIKFVTEDGANMPAPTEGQSPAFHMKTAEEN